MIEYKGYIGQVEFDDEANLLHGEVINTRDVITFQGHSVAELRRALKESIDTYLHYCEKKGRLPDKPFSGKFVLRLTPQQHQKIFLAAKKVGCSFNKWVGKILEESAEQILLGSKSP